MITIPAGHCFVWLTVCIRLDQQDKEVTHSGLSGEKRLVLIQHFTEPAADRALCDRMSGLSVTGEQMAFTLQPLLSLLLPVQGPFHLRPWLLQGVQSHF